MVPQIPGFFFPPRLRGEYSRCGILYSPDPGSSPLTRGISRGSCLTGIAGRIIPAYAGNIVFLLNVENMVEDHPRLRGEYLTKKVKYTDAIGSSPLTRGIWILAELIRCCKGIIPAYAGNILQKALIIQYSFL